MARPGYLSVYVDEKTQNIFDEFVKRKGITKSTALTEMLEIYMLSQDEALYLELKKEQLGVACAKQMIMERSDANMINDYIFMKLGTTFDVNNNPMNGQETIDAFLRNISENGLGYTWFGTESLYFGMAKKKVDYYNKLISQGETVKILFALSDGINEICYSAAVREIVSNREATLCPDDTVGCRPVEFGMNSKVRIWIKIEDLTEEKMLKADMMTIRSTGANLKNVISNSQYHFGYVYVSEEQ